MQMMRKALIAAAAGFAVLASAGCGSGHPGGATSPRAGEAAWTRCMGQHGVDVANPSSDPAKLASAGRACARYAAAATATPLDQAQFRRDVLSWARCMRANGFPQLDPIFPAAGGADFLNADPADPRFAAAAPKCQRYLGSAKGAGT